MKVVVLSIFLLFISSIQAFPNIILFGPPGSGKGTFSQYCEQVHGYRHVCPGDLFRDELNKNSEIGRRIRPSIANHHKVDQKITTYLVTKALEQAIADDVPFVLDAYVKHKEEFEYIITFLQEKNLIENTIVVYFKVDEATCIKRMVGRRNCPICHTVFNLKTRKPKLANTCDFCGAKLSTRSLDLQKDFSKKRHAGYRKKTKPLIKRAKKIFITKKIDGAKQLEELIVDYEKIITS